MTPGPEVLSPAALSLTVPARGARGTVRAPRSSVGSELPRGMEVVASGVMGVMWQ